MEEILTKELVFKKIFNSFNYGNLGMFIGAGFSKAVVNDGVTVALGWLDLIKKASENLNITFPNSKDLIGVSLPELVTALCKKKANESELTYKGAKELFKNEICDLTSWLPSDENLDKYKEILELLNPSWIITTNYDLVMETVLTGKCKSLGPNDYLSAPSNIIPIYHLHGTRLDPDSIIITQEDYIPLFRPNSYRQSKLAMTIRESTTLVLGYGLGDMNVLSALDWSKNIFTDKNEYPHDIIQVLWTNYPTENPYRDENDNLIIEIDNLENFLNELIVYIVNMQEQYDIRLNALKELVSRIEDKDEEYIQEFLTDREFRKALLNLLSEFEYHMIDQYIDFLNECVRGIWFKTSEYLNFEAYKEFLEIIMDILSDYDYKKMPPKLFQITAKYLDRVLLYVCDSPTEQIRGKSWQATDTWFARKGEIPKEMLKQLYNFAKTNNLNQLRFKLDNDFPRE